ncbi:MAG: S8/S53 family peptidase [Saprospiraceae bacterium]
MEVSKEKIVIKFAKGVNLAQQRQLLSKEDLIVPISADQVLPAPNVTLAALKNVQNEQMVYALLKRLNAYEEIVYANHFLVHKDGTQHGIMDEVIVRISDPKDQGPMRFLVQNFEAKIVKQDEFDPLQYHISIGKVEGRNALVLANSLYETGLFEFAEPNFLRLMKRMNTSDAFVNNQWALHNDGNNTSQYGGVAGADMNVFDAWAATTGSASIKIAIIDEGVDLNHPDLKANLLPGYDATGQGSEGGPSGNDAHGTACAGIAAGVGNNNLGIVGVAFSSKIIPVRIAYSSGSSWVTTNSWISNAINWAWQTGNADVLSNSWGGGGSSTAINNAISGAVNNGRGGLGSPVLFAAGNDNGANSYPATYAPTISVIAMSMCNERKSPDSCDGESWWGSNYGTGADVAAPGVKIYATDISGSAGYANGDYISNFNGTSSACPNAAGVMALILSADGTLTEAQARAALEGTCDKVGAYTYASNVAGQPTGTWSLELGYGKINAANAIASLNCEECLLCTDGIQNGQETGVDCGGPICAVCPTCEDGIQNGDETDVDCGGSNCAPCACFEAPLTLTINLDHYPEETSWTLKTSGVTVASGGTYGYLPDLSTVVENINVGEGNYTFTINDSYGDGICCSYGQGSFSLTDNNGALILSGAQFGGSQSQNFCAGEATATCNDGIQNGNETGIDCGGDCTPCATCNDGVQNGNETGIDCGGDCQPCATCNDGVQNGNETGIDCGGDCTPCATCNDGVQNGNETGIDCGGDCQPCATCNDGIQNGNETGIDCGGDCTPCDPEECSNTLINANDFEAGWGIWNDGGADARRSRNDAMYASSGIYCIRLRDNTNSSHIKTDRLNLTNFEEITVDFAFQAISMDNINEDFWLQISTNGGQTYTTVASWAKGVDFENGIPYFKSVVIPGPFSTNTKLKFQCDASNDSDWVYLDDIILSGCTSVGGNTVTVNPANNKRLEETGINGVDASSNRLSNIRLFPNPVSDQLNLHFNLEQESNITLLITDMTGKIMQSQQLVLMAGSQKQIIDVRHFNSGMYFVQLITKDENRSEKIVITH